MFAGAGLRSLFSILKGRKEIFANPTVGLSIGQAATNIPMPTGTAVIQDALNSPQPDRALAVPLVAFHGLSAQEIRAIQLTDVADGRLTVDSRSLREDRILHEVFATGGDVRRICELFGLSVSAAMRYIGEHVEPGATRNGGPQGDDCFGRSTTSDPEAGHR